MNVIGLFSGKAVVVINRGAPRTLRAGDTTAEGVKLISADSKGAVLEIDGKRQTLEMGQHFETASGGEGRNTVTLAPDSRGLADRIELRCGDGSTGWLEAAPFDAIVVSAGAPAVPEALKAQLADGGRLVLPIGGDRHSQRLVRITRRDADRFDEEPLCAVRFVPLIGAQAWPDRATFDRQGD